MGEIKIEKLVLGMVETNCYYIYDEDNREAVVVDPAKEGLYSKLSEKGITIKAIILTHGHFDHILGINDIKENCENVKVYAFKEEADLLKDPQLNASWDIRRPCSINADVLLEDKEEFSLCGIDFKVIATPGHTAGSCCYYMPKQKWLISGDTLFEGSVGRSDLPTGDERKIIESVRMLIDGLEGDVAVYPGHGPETTIGRERSCNPFYS